MNEQSFNMLFARNLRNFLITNNMTQVELAKKLSVGTTSVYNWCNGVKVPRMDKVDKMCEIFSCKRSDLITEAADISAEPSALVLSEVEVRIIEAYRRMSPELKTALYGFMGIKGEPVACETVADIV